LLCGTQNPQKMFGTRSPWSRLRSWTLLLATSLVGGGALHGQTPFKNDNLAILVAASNTASNTTVSVVEIDKVTPGGAVQTIAIAGDGPNPIRVSGGATSTLYAANTNDGTLFCFTGHDSTNTSVNANTIRRRRVVTVNKAGTYSVVTTYIGASGSQTRGATSLDNSTWWIGDQSGFRSNGTSTADPAGNYRGVKAFGGTVYAQSTATGGVGIITAPTGGSRTDLTWSPAAPSTTNLQDFYFVSSAGDDNYDILYLLYTTNVAKYSLVAGTWTANSTSTASGGFGLAAEKAVTGANLYLSTGTGATAANSVRKLVDAAGHNATINITTNTILYTTTAGTTIKGVAFAPRSPYVYEPDPTALSGFNTTEGSPSASQTFDIQADLLTNDLVISAPAGFEVRENGVGSYGPDVSFAAAANISKTIEVRLIGDAAGSPSGDVTITSTGANSRTVAVSGTVVSAGSPLLAVDPVTLPFGTVCINTESAPVKFDITGTSLTTDNVTVGPLAGYLFSETSGGSYTASLDLTQAGGAYSKEVWVKFASTAVQNYDGNIPVGGGGATSVNVGVSGDGKDTPITATGAASAITTNTATAAGTIDDEGCASVSAYGIEWSTTNGFANGTGTQVASSNLSGINFTSDLTGLPMGTTIYYKSYATNSNGTSWGSQQSFTTLRPVITQWNFNALDLDPSIGSGTASAVGMTGAQTFPSGAGSSDPTQPGAGWNITGFPAQGTNSGTAGAVFMVSTVGHEDVMLTYDHRASGTASRWAQVDYTLDGGTSWVTNFWNNSGGISPHDAFYPFTVDFASVPGAQDNPGFGVRIVAIFSPLAFQQNSTSGDLSANTNYMRANAQAVYTPGTGVGTGDYGTGGTWRFDMVTVRGVPVPSIQVDATGFDGAFGNVAVGFPSPSTSFSVSGVNLEGDVTITPPVGGFEIRTGANAFSTNAIDLTPTGGVLSSTSIDVRFNPGATGPQSGDITLTSTNATTRTLAVSGNGVDALPASKLVITNVAPASPFRNAPFNVTVQAQDINNVPVAVDADTPVNLSVGVLGLGTLGGTVSGSILDGQNSVTITGVTYDEAEEFELVASATGLDDGTLNVTVQPVAESLGFVAVPATGIERKKLSPVVTVAALLPDLSTDANYTGAITLSKASGPGTLTGTLTRNAAAGIATFDDLRLDEAGTYTLKAEASGLTDDESGNIVIADGPIAQWDFNGPSNTTVPGGANSPETSIGFGTASLLGGATGETTFGSGIANGGSSDPVTTSPPNYAWQTTTYAAQGTENGQRGIRFNVSTVGFQGIKVTWDHRASNTSARHWRFEYTLNGGTSWVQGPVFANTAGDTWFKARQVDLSNVVGVANNPDFGFRIVAVFAPNTSAYAASNSTSTYGGGTARFDMVTVEGDPFSCTPIAINTINTNSPLCAGTNLSLAVDFAGTYPVDIVWTGTGSFAPSNTTANVSVNGSATGNYSVTVTNDCGSDNSSASITVNPLPTAVADLGPFDCQPGSPNPDVIFTFTGSGTYDFTYTFNGVPTPVSGASSPYVITQAPAGEYQVVALNDANCTGTSLGVKVVGGPYSHSLLFDYDVKDTDPEVVTWNLFSLSTGTLVQTGNTFFAGAGSGKVPTCLPTGCYRLTVTDAGGDGFGAGGGYLLTLADGTRIIDNKGNFTNGATSAIANNGEFCLPLGTDRPILTSCDKAWWRSGEFLVASENPAVSAVYSPASATSGYEFWWFSPNGGYSFRKFRPHNESDGYANVGATRACHVRLNNWAVVNHLPVGQLLNVKVRGVINGARLNWGPACRFVLDPVASECPPTKLLDRPNDPRASCGVIKPLSRGQYIYANPVRRATQYQFRFVITGEGTDILFTSNNYIVELIRVPGLQPGKTYEVTVRGRIGDFCAWGDVCLVTTASQMIGDEEQSITGGTEGLRMWPNPNRGDQLWINLDGIAAGVETVTMDLYDLSGKRIAARVVPTQGEHLNMVIDLNGDLAGGMYVVHVTAGERTYIERLVVQP